jgi:hypothetical protein
MIGNTRITAVITSVCKKLKVPYVSPNQHKVIEFHQDIQKLADLYTELKVIASDLLEISEKYPQIKDLADMIHSNVELLDKVDHDLVVEARKLVRRQEQLEKL